MKLRRTREQRGGGEAHHAGGRGGGLEAPQGRRREYLHGLASPQAAIHLHPACRHVCGRPSLRVTVAAHAVILASKTHSLPAVTADYITTAGQGGAGKTTNCGCRMAHKCLRVRTGRGSLSHGSGLLGGKGTPQDRERRGQVTQQHRGDEDLRGETPRLEVKITKDARGGGAAARNGEGRRDGARGAPAGREQTGLWV